MRLKINSVDMYGKKKIGRYIRIAKKVMVHCVAEHSGVPLEADITFAEDSHIRRLNREYREIDRETDVLSFPMLEAGEQGLEITRKDADAGTGRVFLGDIVISFDKALSQAEEYEHSVERETAFLACHGMLHLLGYDHRDTAEEERMNRKQEEILDRAGYVR
ncbi:MAG: rRNA maturation RNase YbeY [Clostridia bacterium]